ncbi:nucleobase:cation symporter-2 family protein [Corynebacterium sp.]|uniref:nucleobase:cation symporter-2 family protein n=1 Tax=Corynebacterium sp. TaxID=1720 RepID=UPI00264920DE|nr:nucleobase:cation symporter-2 family protein [Corynebacterium sp.]MDN5721158.1 purine permease [Corynebacterium sp.]
MSTTDEYIPGTIGAVAPDGTHPVDQKPPLLRTFILGLQHVLAMYAGAIAVPLIVGGALVAAGEFEAEHMHHLIVADLFVAGIASVIQSLGFWRFGSRLPLIQGVSFVSVAPMISIGSEHGITAIYGSVIATGVLMMLIAPFFAKVVRYFPPLVIGTVITVVGLSLLSVAAGWLFNQNGPANEQGTGQNFLLALGTLVVVVCIHRFAPAAWKSMAVLGGIVVGTVAGVFVGASDFSAVGEADWVGVPMPFQFGTPTFDIASILTMLLVGLVIMTETSGDIVAVGEITGRRATPRSLADGLRADGLATLLGGVFNTFPYSAFAQNVGLVSLSRVASRYVVTAAGLILIVLGLLPKVGEIATGIPSPVLGGAGVALFGMVAASGIRTLATVTWTETRALIVGVSVALAMLPAVFDGLYANLPDSLEMILDSGITVGAVSVILLNLLLNREGGGHLAEDTLEEELQDELQDAQDAPAGPSGLRAVPAPASSSEV